jgi:Putative zinc-finger
MPWRSIVTCDEVREQLAEHLLGTLDPDADAAVRSHLRGCAACRRERETLEEGVAMFARAAHELSPPEDLRDRTLSVLRDEWDEPPVQPAPRWTTPRRLAVAATVAAIGVATLALAWGLRQDSRADRYEIVAAKYERFLEALGGRSVRVGILDPRGEQQLEGSVVLYDSNVGQSWVLVLVRAPGLEGEAGVTLSSASGTTIDMHALSFDEGGEASTWLVTGSNLEPFDTVTVWQPRGHVLAQAHVGPA